MSPDLYSKYSGNHAAALALAANLRGIPAYIVVPKNAPKCKVENVMRYGGQVIWSEATMQSRESTAAKVLQETGAVLLHPYNDRRIIRYEFDFILTVTSLIFYSLVKESERPSDSLRSVVLMYKHH